MHTRSSRERILKAGFSVLRKLKVNRYHVLKRVSSQAANFSQPPNLRRFGHHVHSAVLILKVLNSGAMRRVEDRQVVKLRHSLKFVGDDYILTINRIPRAKSKTAIRPANHRPTNHAHCRCFLVSCFMGCFPSIEKVTVSGIGQRKREHNPGSHQQ